jgi:hypothetical protein
MSTSEATTSSISELLAASGQNWDDLSELAKSAPSLTDTEFGLLSDLNTQFPHNPVSSSSYSSSSFSSSSAAAAAAQGESSLTNVFGQSKKSNLNNTSSSSQHRQRRRRGRITRKQLEEKLRMAPKLPDLRFERGYRASIAAADGCWWKIVLITIRDQVTMPLIQGVLWNLTLVGVKSWRMAASVNGGSWGSKYTTIYKLFPGAVLYFYDMCANNWF